MKRLKYSVLARFLAVLFAVLFAGATAFGSFTAVVIQETGLYSRPLEQVISENFQALQRFYSAKIYLNKDDNPDCLENTNLEYGIIRGDSIENINLDDKSAYDYYNFHATNPNKNSFAISFYENQVTYFDEEPTFLESLFNQYDYDIYDGMSEDASAPVKNILYDEENGIFYYKTPEYLFPVHHIYLSTYYAKPKENDSAKEQAAKLVSGYISFTLNTKKLQYESDSGLFEPLDTTQYHKWQRFSTQPNYWFHPCWFHPSDIMTLSDDDLSTIVNTKENETQLTLNEGNEAAYRNSDIRYMINYNAATLNSLGKTYYIISNIAEPLYLPKNDLFVQQKNALTFLYNIRIPCLVITGCSFACFLLMLAFCCYSTGCRADNALVPVTWLHKLPLLLYLTGIGACIAGLVCVIIWCIEFTIHDNAFALVFLLICLFLTALLLVLAAMNLSRRYKAGILWKSTLSCLTISGIRRLASRGKKGLQHILYLFQEHTSLLLKGILIFGAICLVETILLLFAIATYGDGTILWLVFKAAELIIILAVLLQLKQLQTGSRLLAEGQLNHKLDTSHMLWEFKKHAECLNQIGDGMTIALEERMKSEHFRTELITNVSHDIKTPLTSIINYIDLLQKENISPETAKEYLDVLERQSARLKKLIEDLMEASKASTGSMAVNLEECDIDILLTQIFGEFEEKLYTSQLELITQSPDTSVLILADNRHLWRIFENLMNNICKYAQPGTRVYVNWEAEESNVRIIFRNISKYALNISGEDLLERFVRGDVSRSTEGNGLGLSIAQSLAELMKGTLRIVTDGDLFKAILTFPRSV